MIRVVHQLLLGCAAVLACVAGAMQHADAAAEGKRVAVFMGPTQDKYLGALSKSFETTATGSGMKVTVFSSPFDPALQAQQIDDAVAQKYDLLVVQIISQRAIIPVLTRVKNAGIPVVLVVAPMVGNENNAQDLYLTHVGYDDTKFGGLIGEAMVKALKDSGRTKSKIAVLAGSMAEGKAPLREKGFRDAVAKHPGMEVVVTEDVKWNPAVGERAAGQLLARFAGQGGLDGFYGMNDVVANGAIQAAEAAGVKVGTAAGNLIVVGGNCQAPGVKNIEAGKQAATLLMLPIEEGKITGARVKDYFEGKTPEKITFLPTETITKANIAQHAQACSY
jgi:ABC-type sugar transport system substrate-binding protein